MCLPSFDRNGEAKALSVRLLNVNVNVPSAYVWAGRLRKACMERRYRKCEEPGRTMKGPQTKWQHLQTCQHKRVNTVVLPSTRDHKIHKDKAVFPLAAHQAVRPKTDGRTCAGVPNPPDISHHPSPLPAQSCLFSGLSGAGCVGSWASAFSCCPRVAVTRFLLPRSAAPLQVLWMKWTCRRFWVSFCRCWTGRIRGPGRGPAPNHPSTCWNCTTNSTTTTAPRRRPTSSGASGTKVRRLSLFCFWWILVFFICLHTKSLLVTQFLKAVTETAEAHTRSAKPDTNSWPLTQFHETLFAKHNTQISM